MRLSIAEPMIQEHCSTCPNYKGKIKRILPLSDIYLISCISSGEQEAENCPGCTGTLDYVGTKYGPMILLTLSEMKNK